MTPTTKATQLGITFPIKEPGYLKMCSKVGNLYFTSGHVSNIKGKVGAGVTTEEGYQAARECAIKLLQSLHQDHGTLDGIRVVKLYGMVNSAPDYIDHHLVINGASDLFHEIYGKTGDGYHARSAVGLASLPTGVAVEVEAIFEIWS